MSKTKTWKERIEALVKRFGSREAVALKLGVSYWAVVSWLSRGKTPMPIVQEKIAEVERRKK